MTTTPDRIEVVATSSEAAALDQPPLIVLEPLEHYLDELGLGTGPVDWQRIGEGQSNVTFRIRRDGADVVLRRGPRPPLPKSTHDMVREARLQRAVSSAGIPVPTIHAICEDESILGVPFYLMGHLHGEVVTDKLPAQLAGDADRARVATATIDALVALHGLDVTAAPLSTYGRPDGYLERQVRRFRSLWSQNSRRTLPDIDLLGDWLAEHLPPSQRAAVVHGDYRIGNIMFAPDAPVRVLAILDWEMATLGDPLADLGYFAATYVVPGGVATPMDLTTVTREPGFPSLDELIERYRAQTQLDLTDLHWYETLALWKASIFCEAIYTRWLDGERPNDITFGPALEDGIPAMLEVARHAAGVARHPS